MTLIEMLLGQKQQPINTPGINPNEPDPSIALGGAIQGNQGQGAQGVFGKLDNFINKPGGGFLMNLLAQSGRSLTPGPSPIGAIGRAALATQGQQRQSGQDDLRKRLIESQIGLNTAKSEGGVGAGQRIVQSAQTLANGNVGFLNAFTGEVVDTGAKAGGKGQIIDMPGVGQVIYDPTTNILTQANPEDVIRIAEAERAGSKEQAVQDVITDAIPKQVSARIAATDAAKSRIEIPENIAAAEPLIAQGEGFIQQLESGQLSTGPLRGQFPAFTTEEQLFEAYSGAQLLEQISSVTLGALSKGEMDFLKTTVTNRTNTPEANIQIIKQKNDILLAAAKRGREKLGISEFKPIGEMTDEELRELIERGRREAQNGE